VSPSLSIRDGLAAATCALIGINTPAPVDASDLETSLLVYTEQAGRLNTYESVTRLRQQLSGDKFFIARLVVDIMTGASPNGAAPSTEPQTFTRPSGKGSYVISPGETPLDNTFQDNRFALDASLEVPLDRNTLLTVGGHGSLEYDYFSVGVNGSLSRDFNKRNTRLSAGFALSQDYLDPEGGAPVPFAPMLPPQTPPIRQTDQKDKTVVDGLFGISQVLTRRAAVRLNYTMSYADGYLTDPFKVLSVVDGTPGPDQGLPLEYIYENRPASRLKQSVFGSLKYHLTRNVFDASYRYMWDDWKIYSHTFNVRYRYELSNNRFLQPQFRWYHQTGAFFYRHSLVDGNPTPAFASADYRLGEFDAFTFAVRYGMRPGGHMVNLRLGYYVQMGDRSPPNAIGVQRTLDLFPTVHAIIAQLTYGIPW